MAETERSAYEIPNEMRDFADRSVEQARKAFDGFVDAAFKASSAIETHTESAQGDLRAVAGAAVSYAEQNVQASFAYAQKLVRANSLEEVMSIQSEFARSQIETLTRQLRDMSTVAGKGRAGD